MLRYYKAFENDPCIYKGFGWHDQSSNHPTRRTLGKYFDILIFRVNISTSWFSISKHFPIQMIFQSKHFDSLDFSVKKFDILVFFLKNIDFSCKIFRYLGFSCKIFQYFDFSSEIFQFLVFSRLIFRYHGFSCEILRYLCFSCKIFQYIGSIFRYK